MAAFRWESLIWPRWLPETARMPLVAQVAGAVALTALIMGPWWARVTAPLPEAHRPTSLTTVPYAAPASIERPAHLNLDVRHSFGSVSLVVTVDGKLALQTRLEGSGKKFKMFGKRAERAFTRTLDLQPGVRVVRVRIQSNEHRFDQTRVERFELAPASVATLRISAEKSTGLVVRADRPPASPQAPAVQRAAMPAAATALPTATGVPPPSITQQANALAALLNSLRSMLIAIAGFVASAATGFVVQEFLRSKKRVIFARAEGEAPEVRRRSHSQVTPAVEP